MPRYIGYKRNGKWPKKGMSKFKWRDPNKEKYKKIKDRLLAQKNER